MMKSSSFTRPILSGAKVLLMFFLAAFALSCENKNMDESTTISIGDRKKKDLVIDDLFTLKRIIPLATSDSTLIINIAKVYMHNESIIFFDNFSSEIFHYDTAGMLKRKIAKLGQGPGEYLRISDIIVDFDENLCYVLDGMDSKKVIKYNLDGDLISEYRLGFGAASFYKINQNSFAFYCGNASSAVDDERYFHNLIYTDSLFQVKASTFPINKNWDGYAFTSGARNTFFYKPSQGEVKFVPQLPANMAVYDLSEVTGDIALHKNIAYPNSSTLETLLDGLSRDEIPNTFNIMRKGDFTYNMHNYMENACFTFFSASRGRTIRVALNNSEHSVYYENTDTLDAKHGPYFSPLPVWTSSADDIAVNVLTPLDILQKDFELAIPLREQVDINDNPVLVFYEFRHCNQ